MVSLLRSMAKRRIPVTLQQMPPELIKAFIATEDSRFYEHHGVDPVGIFVQPALPCSQAMPHRAPVRSPSS